VDARKGRTIGNNGPKGLHWAKKCGAGEGRLIYGYQGVDVGNRLKVQLIHTDVEKGYIDFKKIHLGL